MKIEDWESKEIKNMMDNQSGVRKIYFLTPDNEKTYISTVL